jgi:hypothetical protein
LDPIHKALNPYNMDSVSVHSEVLRKLGRREDAAKKETVLRETKKAMGFRAADKLRKGG